MFTQIKNIALHLPKIESMQKKTHYHLLKKLVIYDLIYTKYSTKLHLKTYL